MAATTKVAVAGVQPTTAGTDVYTVPNGQTFTVQALSVLNTDLVNARKITFYRVPPGGAVNAASKIVHEMNIAPKDRGTVYELLGQAIAGGGRLHAVAEANTTISVHLTGSLSLES